MHEAKLRARLEQLGDDLRAQIRLMDAYHQAPEVLNFLRGQQVMVRLIQDIVLLEINDDA